MFCFTKATLGDQIVFLRANRKKGLSIISVTLEHEYCLKLLSWQCVVSTEVLVRDTRKTRLSLIVKAESSKVWHCRNPNIKHVINFDKNQNKWEGMIIKNAVISFPSYTAKMH